MKRLLTVFITLVFVLTALAVPSSFAAKDSESGTGDSERSTKTIKKDTDWFDEDDPKKEYSITTEAQLIGLASLVNEQQERWKDRRFETFEGVTFTLNKDIRLTREWTPIGSGTVSYFAGIFDGNGHTISGLNIDALTGNTGFFGYVTGEVRDLNIAGKIKSGDSNSGGIAGQTTASSRIINCSADVEISARDKTGGIVGYNDNGRVEGCRNFGDISGTIKVGGVVGENWGGIISECSNEGVVKSSDRGVATYGTGGIAGRSVASTAEVSQSFNRGEINSVTEATGGIVGYTNARNSTVTDCYNLGDIHVKDAERDGDLVKSAAGGIVGTVGTDGIFVSNCYFAGNITGADMTGGIIGRYIYNDYRGDSREELYITNNYYLNDTVKYGIGDNNGEGGMDLQQSVEGLAQGSLRSMTSALGAAYKKDSSGLYGNSGYPVLRWQEPVSNEEKSYISEISRDIQEKLDDYLVASADKKRHGQVIMDFFNPGDMLSRSLVLFTDAKEKLKGADTTDHRENEDIRQENR
ncbi:MAG: hypothetical protein Q4C25_07830 [Bacillota bacterium]|nr:hypothetical protein [Bacillota bacterium]